MADIKISELLSAAAVGTSFVPVSNAAGTATNKVTLADIAGLSSGDTLLRSLFVPPAPTSVTAAVGNAQVTVSWTASSVLAQTPITDYIVQFSSDSGSNWTTFSDATSTATTATVTGLTNGTAYTFRVAATNALGTGAVSLSSNSATPSAAVLIITQVGTGTGAWAGNGTLASKFTRTAVGSASGPNYWAVDPIFTATSAGAVYITMTSREQSSDWDPELLIKKNGVTVQTLSWSSIIVSPVSVLPGDTVQLSAPDNGQKLNTVAVWLQ